MRAARFRTLGSSTTKWIFLCVATTSAFAQTPAGPSYPQPPSSPGDLCRLTGQPSKPVVNQTGLKRTHWRPLPVINTTTESHRDYLVLVYDAEHHYTAFYDYDSKKDSYAIVPNNGAFLPVIYTKEKILVRVCNLHPTDTISISGNSFSLPEQGGDIRGTTPATVPALSPTLDTLGNANPAGSPFGPAGVSFGSPAPLTSIPVSGFIAATQTNNGYNDAVINVSPEALAIETVALVRNAQDAVNTIRELNAGGPLPKDVKISANADEGSIKSLRDQANRLLDSLKQPPASDSAAALGWFNQRLAETLSLVTELNGLANGVSQSGLGPRAVALRQNYESILGVLKQVHQVIEDDKKINRSSRPAAPVPNPQTQPQIQPRQNTPPTPADVPPTKRPASPAPSSGNDITESPATNNTNVPTDGEERNTCQKAYEILSEDIAIIGNPIPADTPSCRAVELHTMETFLDRYNKQLGLLIRSTVLQQSDSLDSQVHSLNNIVINRDQPEKAAAASAAGQADVVVTDIKTLAAALTNADAAKTKLFGFEVVAAKADVAAKRAEADAATAEAVAEAAKADVETKMAVSATAKAKAAADEQAAADSAQKAQDAMAGVAAAEARAAAIANSSAAKATQAAAQASADSTASDDPNIKQEAARANQNAATATALASPASGATNLGVVQPGAVPVVTPNESAVAKENSEVNSISGTSSIAAADDKVNTAKADADAAATAAAASKLAASNAKQDAQKSEQAKNDAQQAAYLAKKLAEASKSRADSLAELARKMRDNAQKAEKDLSAQRDASTSANREACGKAQAAKDSAIAASEKAKDLGTAADVAFAAAREDEEVKRATLSSITVHSHELADDWKDLADSLSVLLATLQQDSDQNLTVSGPKPTSAATAQATTDPQVEDFAQLGVQEIFTEILKMRSDLSDLDHTISDIFKRLNDQYRKTYVEQTDALPPFTQNALERISINVQRNYTPFTITGGTTIGTAATSNATQASATPTAGAGGGGKGGAAGSGAQTGAPGGTGAGGGGAAATTVGSSPSGSNDVTVLMEVHRRATFNLVGGVMAIKVPTNTYTTTIETPTYQSSTSSGTTTYQAQGTCNGTTTNIGAPVASVPATPTPYYCIEATQTGTVQLAGMAGVEWFIKPRDYFPYKRAVGTRPANYIPSLLVASSVTSLGSAFVGGNIEPVNGFNFFAGLASAHQQTFSKTALQTTYQPVGSSMAAPTLTPVTQVKWGFSFGVGFDLSVFLQIFSKTSGPQLP